MCNRDANRQRIQASEETAFRRARRDGAPAVEQTGTEADRDRGTASYHETVLPLADFGTVTSPVPLRHQG